MTIGIILLGQGLFCAYGYSESETQTIQLKNKHLKYTVQLDASGLLSETLTTHKHDALIKSDGDFLLEIVWADWLPPGKLHHGDNPARLSKKDFILDRVVEVDRDGEGQKISVYFKGRGHHLDLRMSYEVKPTARYIKKTIAIRDPIYQKHFLHQVNVLNAHVQLPGDTEIANEGGFGQPVAVHFSGGGFFYGLEYPASNNVLQALGGDAYQISSGKFVGQKISSEWYESEKLVLGITPNGMLKLGFMEYLEDIKVQPAIPFTLYNTWYDLRGRGYTVGRYVKKLHANDYMSEENVDRLYQLIKKNFIDKYDVPLDALVLDDGWDDYASDWQLRAKDFPRGLKPLIENLRRDDTHLGLWFGPSGGYSDRMKRINWYQENGFEVTGEEKQWGGAQLCLAGQNYRKLFSDRSKAFVQSGIAYYKWDGIQFSCNETNHGHPIGLYSQVAILNAVLKAIEDIRDINPRVYQSVTSGTWLSPWWLMHANQIWMQGDDYGYADAPAISQRDAAMTYRDSVLYDNFQVKNIWFPISHMMTHGIIKGKLENLHIQEPLDKFTDNAVMYFARGVSMYELYTSPDIMSDDEWRVVAQALRWAKHNFDLLQQTEMIGGDPAQGQAYGYVHYKGNQGIVALRNPSRVAQDIVVPLLSSYGLSAQAQQLVLEKYYPYRYIEPLLYKAKDEIVISLDAYETALYELYPLAQSMEPLLAGVPFFSHKDHQGQWSIRYHQTGARPHFLNGEKIKKVSISGREVPIQSLPYDKTLMLSGLESNRVKRDAESLLFELTLNDQVKNARLAFWVSAETLENKTLPKLYVYQNGKAVSLLFEGDKIDADLDLPNKKAAWYTMNLEAGSHHFKVAIPPHWKAAVEVWVYGYVLNDLTELTIKSSHLKGDQRVFPPAPIEEGYIKFSHQLQSF